MSTPVDEFVPGGCLAARGLAVCAGHRPRGTTPAHPGRFEEHNAAYIRTPQTGKGPQGAIRLSGHRHRPSAPGNAKSKKAKHIFAIPITRFAMERAIDERTGYRPSGRGLTGS